MPRDFDWVSDRICHPFVSEGRVHMEYLVDHCPRMDLPWEELVTRYQDVYPIIAKTKDGIGGDFAAESARVNY